MLKAVPLMYVKPYQIQVTFEGIRGSSSKGDIAIDDVTVSPGSCSGNPPTPPPPQPPTPPSGKRAVFAQRIKMVF